MNLNNINIENHIEDINYYINEKNNIDLSNIRLPLELEYISFKK